MTRLLLAGYAVLVLCLFLMWRTSEEWREAAQNWEKGAGSWRSTAEEWEKTSDRWRALTEKAVKQLDDCDAETDLWRRGELRRRSP